MIGNLFRSHKPRRPERPTFRPVLESLENREVPSAAQVSAAFFELPGAVNTLVGSLQARPANATSINTNFNNVAGDMALLEYSARNFVVPDRLQIDNALTVNGFILLYQAFKNYPNIPAPQFVETARLGVSAIQAGLEDFFVAGLFPQTSDDAVLS